MTTLKNLLRNSITIINSLMNYIKILFNLLFEIFSSLAVKLSDYLARCTRFKVYKISIETIPNYWVKDTDELKFVIVKEIYFMISYYGLFVMFLIFLLILWFLKYLFTIYILYKYQIITNSELFMLPLMARTVRRGLFISSIRQKFGPISKTLANKFSVVSLISMLSLETFTSLVFLIIFYLWVILLLTVVNLILLIYIRKEKNLTLITGGQLLLPILIQKSFQK